MQFTIIGNPENRRCRYFVEAAKSEGFAAPFVISYLDLLQSKVDLDAIFSKTDCLRIESFGENFEVERHLLALAANHFSLGAASQIRKKEALELSLERGLIQYGKQLHLGYCQLLNQIEQKLAQYPTIQVMNSPKSIQLMFDKAACHQHFVQQNISVAPAIYGIKNYEDFCTQIQAKNWQNVFIKPCYSSSASGVIAFKTNGKKIKAITSAKMELERNQFKVYNSLKLSTYTKKKDIAVLIDFLAKEDIIVEKWIPKANTAKGVFDLRMVVIGGKAQHAVMRQSQSPLTNLHLGNERGDLEALKQQLGAEKWKSIQTFAEQAAQTLPHTLYTGLDVLVSNNHKKNYVIEANAFGDLLPNIFIDNKDTYQTAIHYAKEQYNASKY